MMFYKGEKVYEVIARSRDGSMMIMTRTVESCGQKKGTLRSCRTGSMTKSFFYPPTYDSTGRSTLRGNFHGLYSTAKVSREEVEAIAFEIGRQQLIYERAHYARCLDREANPDAGEPYYAVMQATLDNLPVEPTVTWVE